ncbi:DMT family transporter [Microlunatus panaciterrae]
MPVSRWLPGMLGLAAIWGSSFLFIKVGVSALHPLYVAFGRVASGAVALLLVLAVLRQGLPRDRVLWLHNAFIGVVGTVLPFSLFAFGERHIDSLLAGIWNSTTPLIVLPMAVLVFRTEHLTVRRTVGLTLGFVGALVILGIWHGADGTSVAGQLMCLAAACCYGVAIPYTKRFIAPRPESGLVMSTCQLLVASVVLAVAAPLITGTVPHPDALPWQVVASVLLLGAVGTGFAFIVNMRNIRLVGASTASMVTYIIPVFAVLVGVLVLDEHLTWYQPVGAGIVLAGVAVSQGLLSRRPSALALTDGAAAPTEACSATGPVD